MLCIALASFQLLVLISRSLPAVKYRHMIDAQQRGMIMNELNFERLDIVDPAVHILVA